MSFLISLALAIGGIFVLFIGCFIVLVKLFVGSENQADYLEYFTSDGQPREEVFSSSNNEQIPRHSKEF